MPNIISLGESFFCRMTLVIWQKREIRQEVKNVAGNYLSNTARFRLRCMATSPQGIRHAEVQDDGRGSSATRHRYIAQLSLFRTSLYSSGLRRPQSAGRFRSVCCLLGL